METEVVTKVTNENENKKMIVVYEIRTDSSKDLIVTNDFDEAMAIVREVFEERGGKLVKMRCSSMKWNEYEKLEDV